MSMNTSPQSFKSQSHKNISVPLDLLVLSTACHTAVNRNVYKLFVKGGWSVALVIPTETKFSSGKRYADLPKVDDPPIIFKPLFGGNLRVYRFQGMIEILNELRPQIILIDNDPISFMALEVGKWAKKNGSNLFCISCENIPLGIFQTVKRKGIKGVLPALFKRCFISRVKNLVDGVFTINNEGTDILAYEGFKNVKKIPLGFDPSIFYIDNVARLKIRNKFSLKGKVFGFFGRLIYEKGAHILIAALEHLKDYEWTLVMDQFSAYNNVYSSEIKNIIAETKLLDRVVYVNPTHSEMGDYLNAVDLVVMPSISTPVWEEQYGRIAAEAMACGKSVVASRSGSLPMLLGDYGIIFPEGDVDTLSEILRAFLTDEVSRNAVYSSDEVSKYAHKYLSIDRQKDLMKLHFKMSIK